MYAGDPAMAADTTRLAMVLATALGVTLLLTPLVRRAALRAGFLAVPGRRSVHRRPVPYLGGLAMCAGFVAALLVGLGARHELARVVGLGAVATALLGAVDDRFDLRPGIKLAGMAAIASLTAWAGVRIEWATNPLGGLLYLPPWASVPLSAFWIVALMNVMNLVDGLDGLAAGLAGIAAVTLLLTALQHPQPSVAGIGALMSAAVLGAAVGFLPYNFNPARIFMGDAGSLMLGYALAVTSIEGTLKSATALALAVPILALGLPIADTALAIARRLRAGRPIAQADRGHLHHRLLDLGLSHREAVIVMYLVSAWLGVGAIALSRLSPGQALLIVALAALTLYFGIKKVGLASGERKDVRH